MWERSNIRTLDNLSRLAIMWTYLCALLALWGRIELVAKEAQRARETAVMAIDMAMETKGR